MLRTFTTLQLLFVIFSSIYCDVRILDRDKRGRKKDFYNDKTLWKKEYEQELTDAMLSPKRRENATRMAQPQQADNEVVLEKLMDTITSSEKYLKKIDSIDFRLNRLDIEVHDKTNAIINQLTAIAKGTPNDAVSEKLDALVDAIKSEANHLKGIIEKRQDGGSVDGPPNMYHADASQETRLSSMEAMLRSIMSGVDSIAGTMAEVKNRQVSRTFTKAEHSPTLDPAGVINEFRKMLSDQRHKKCDCRTGVNMMGRVDRADRFPTDCHEIQMQGFNVSGIYKIKPDDMEPFYILCDLTTAGGGWIVFQNRYDGSQDFFKGWSDYKYGFGNLAGEFWLGLEKLHYLTNQKLYELRIEVETQHGQEAYAGYSVFTVGPEHEGFRISTLGTYYGTAGDSLTYHAGQKFSTVDMDNDEWKEGSCAVEHGGAWWYKECDKSNLNGKYSQTADENRGQSIYWISFKDPNFPLTKTKMMIRPLPATKPSDFEMKSMEVSRARPAAMEIKSARPKEIKPPYDVSRNQYRYDDSHNAFFPNFN